MVHSDSIQCCSKLFRKRMKHLHFWSLRWRNCIPLTIACLHEDFLSASRSILLIPHSAELHLSARSVEVKALWLKTTRVTLSSDSEKSQFRGKKSRLPFVTHSLFLFRSSKRLCEIKSSAKSEHSFKSVSRIAEEEEKKLSCRWHSTGFHLSARNTDRSCQRKECRRRSTRHPSYDLIWWIQNPLSLVPRVTTSLSTFM